MPYDVIDSFKQVEIGDFTWRRELILIVRISDIRSMHPDLVNQPSEVDNSDPYVCIKLDWILKIQLAIYFAHDEISGPWTILDLNAEIHSKTKFDYAHFTSIYFKSTYCIREKLEQRSERLKNIPFIYPSFHMTCVFISISCHDPIFHGPINSDKANMAFVRITR